MNVAHRFLLISGPRVRVPGGAPDFERQIVRFGVLSLCKKAAAHFLHTVCTACFPLHKKSLVGARPLHLAGADRSVTQTPHWGVCCFANAKALGEQGSRQFSAFVCVHQPDGFKDLLTRDFCCRWLFVLPGLRCCRGQVLRGHRRVSHADGHAVFEAQRAKRQQKSRHKTDQPCPRFFWKVMLVGYVNG